MEISKKMIEDDLGFEINDNFKVEVNNGMINVYVEKKQSMGIIENRITIQKTGEIFNE